MKEKMDCFANKLTRNDKDWGNDNKIIKGEKLWEKKDGLLRPAKSVTRNDKYLVDGLGII